MDDNYVDRHGQPLRTGQLVRVLAPREGKDRTFVQGQRLLIGKELIINRFYDGTRVSFVGHDYIIPPSCLEPVLGGLRGLAKRYQLEHASGP